MIFINCPRSFLIVGLESSCSRHVSILIASNLGIVPVGEWDGEDGAENTSHRVVHRSLPHGPRENFVSKGYWMSFQTVVMCTRDIGCSLESKMLWHQHDRKLAEKENQNGVRIMGEILAKHPKVEIFSYESAYILGRIYNEAFFKRIGVPYVHHIETEEINSKYMKGRTTT
jgi:hypothetical protein